LRVALAAALAFVAGCATGPEPARSARAAGGPAPISEEALRAHVAALTADGMNGRLAGSPGERMAAEYVAREFDAADLGGPRGMERLQAVPLPGRGDGSVNVVGVVAARQGEKTARFIVVGAHLDHVGRDAGQLRRGAEDNASGVAVLIEVGRALARRREELDRSVLLVAFGAQERGTLGSAAFVARPPVGRDRIAAMVNIDMIGRKLVDQLRLGPVKLAYGVPGDGVGVGGTAGRPALRRIVDDAFKGAGLRALAPEDLPPAVGANIERATGGRGDYAPFQRAGITALSFSAGESDDYHKPSDVADKLDFALMARRGRAIVETVIGLSRADSLR
jgi:Zn-dependent M28 family amino/carboxypeptidase